MIKIKLNNKDKDIEENSSISALIELLGLNPHSIVTEVNLNIIQKDKREDYILNDGDKVEIITFLGGG